VNGPVPVAERPPEAEPARSLIQVDAIRSADAGDRRPNLESGRAASRAVRPSRIPAPPPAAGSSASLVIQRSVGLELEHSVPIYQNLPGVSQEESLRTGSYSYDNTAPVYTVGDVVVKTDNTDYSSTLKAYLEQNNRQRLKTAIPSKGVSIAEYTTAAPGLDELAPGAAQTFYDHAQRVDDQVRQNEKDGQTGPTYYVGLPPGIKPGDAAGYGALGFQVTVGVFPSQLDKLHRLAVEEGLADYGPRHAQNVITAIIDKHLEPVITQISDPIEDLAKVGGDLWAPARLQLIRGTAPGNANVPFDQWEAALAPEAELFRRTFADTVRSVFRVALSYYVGARDKIPSGQIEKNAVALLARVDLGDVFTRAGLTYPRSNLNPPPVSFQSYAQKLFAEHFTKLVRARSDDIADTVKQVLAEENYALHPNAEVLSEPSVVDLMINLVDGNPIHQITPGIKLPAPDPLALAVKYAEPFRPERGGSQFEYRTVSIGGWRSKFLTAGRHAFLLNTEHLAPGPRATLGRDTGWDDG
jgi:hypothetical protein